MQTCLLRLVGLATDRGSAAFLRVFSLATRLATLAPTRASRGSRRGCSTRPPPFGPPEIR